MSNQEKAFKFIAAFILVSLFISYLFQWYHLFVEANFWVHAQMFVTILYGASPILLAYILYLAVKGIYRIKV